MFSTAIKRTVLGTAAALILSAGALAAIPAQAAEPDTALQQFNVEQKIKIFMSDDGKVVLICHYTDAGRLLYCDVTSPAN